MHPGSILQVLVAGQLEVLEQGRDYLAALLLVEGDGLLAELSDICECESQQRSRPCDAFLDSLDPVRPNFS